MSVGITAHDEFVNAFGKAKTASRNGQVLVERFVPGDDHRISVFNGKVMRVNRLTPPKVILPVKLNMGFSRVTQVIGLLKI